MIRQDGTTGEGGQPVGGDWYQRWFPLAVTFAFLGLAGFAIANHELWRDETQAWLIARDSSSLPELFRHTRYEGHPGLWFICLYIVSRVTTSPIAMQMLHLGIGAGSVWIFARYAPFTLWQRALLAFGYFPLFEYTVVSRDYGLGVLLLLGACAVLGEKPVRFPLLVTLLALVPQTNAFAAMLGLALGLALLADLRLPGGPVLAANATRRQYAWGLVVVGVSLALAAAQMIPPADSGIFVGWHTQLEWGLLGKRLRSLGAAVFPVPTIQNRWWISPFLWDLEPVRVPLAIIVYALFTWVAIGLTRRLRALTFLVAALGAQLAFIYLKLPGEMRHWGHFFIALVMALWLGKIETARQGTASDGWIGRAWASTQGPLFTALLGFHAVGGVLAVALDHRYQFSNGRRAAAYLVAHGLDRVPLVAEPDFLGGPVLAYLEPRQAYYPRGNRFGSFEVWDLARVAPVADSTCVERSRRLAAEQGGLAVLLLNHPLAVAPAESLGTRELTRFVGSTVGDEDFYLYCVSPRPGP